MKKLLLSVFGAAAGLALSAGIALAASTVVVTPTNTQGWASADTRANGAITFVEDATTAYGDAALQLTTGDSNLDKAQYLTAYTGSLSSLSTLAYSTKQVAGPPTAAASFQILVDLNGAGEGGFTTLVYEPYWNGTVVPTDWQSWDIDSGLVWSSRTFTDGTCAVVNGAGGPPLYNFSALQVSCPDAVVQAVGVNVGSYNPNYNVLVDGVIVNDTTYDFELTSGPVVMLPTSKDACKKGGYMNFTDAEGNPFKNQGQCVSYFNNM